MNSKKVTKGLIGLLQSFLSEGGYYSDSRVSSNGALKAKQLELKMLLASLQSGQTPEENKIINILQDIQVGDNAYLKIGDINVTDKMITYNQVANIRDYVGTYIDKSTHYHSHSNSSNALPKPFAKKHWELPARNPFFVGREPLLKDIKTHLDKQSIGVVSQSLTGLGGVGKTHLALEYANTVYDDKPYDFVIWLSGQSLQAEFELLAHDALGIHNVKDYAEQPYKLLNKIYDELSDRYTRLLIVIDDVKDEKAVQPYLPKTRWPREKTCHVLLTSRAHTWSKASRVVVSSFTQEEAIEYIKKSKLEQSISPDDANALASCLGYFPLALSQAVAYLRENEELSIRDYLADYNSTAKRCRKLLSYSIVADTTSQEENDKKLAVYTTWYISVQQLRKTHPKAEIILNLASFLPSQKILHPIVRLAMGMEKTSDKSAFSKLLSALRSYSLITSSRSKESTEATYIYFTMHQLVQTVIRLHLEQEYLNPAKIHATLLSWTNELMGLPQPKTAEASSVTLSIPQRLAIEDKVLHTSFFSSALKQRLNSLEATLKTYWLARLLWAVSRHYNHDSLDPKHYLMVHTLYLSAHEVATWSDEEELITEESYHLWLELGNYQADSRAGGILGLSNYRHAEKIYQDLGEPKNHVYAGLLNNQANAYGYLGNHQKQKSVLVEALPILEKHYGRTHPEVAKTLANLGIAYRELGELGEAKTHLQNALTILEKHYGRTHPSVAITLMNLGDAYRALGELGEAKTCLLRALPIQEKHYSRTHPEVAKTLLNLGNAYLDLGEPGEAKTHLQCAFKINEKHYGPTHPKVAITLTNLGNAYRALGEPTEAKTCLLRALVIQERHYGRMHPEVAKTLTNLGYAYNDLGQPDEAKVHLLRALTIQEKHYGRTHPEVAKTLTNLGNAYRALGEPNEAKTHLQRALTINEKYYGSTHPELATTLANLGGVYRVLGKLVESKSYIHRALLIKEKHYGPNHQETAIIRAVLGQVHEAAGEIEAAIHCFELSLPILKRAKVVWVSIIEKTLQRCLSKSPSTSSNQPSTSKSSMNASFFKQSEESLHSEQASRVKNQAGLVLFKAGKYEDALPVFLKALSLGQQCHTPGQKNDDFCLASLHYNLGACYQALSQLDKAKTHLESSLVLRTPYLEENHKDIQKVQRRLATLTASTSDDSHRLSRN